jgi:hypothetical protein
LQDDIANLSESLAQGNDADVQRFFQRGQAVRQQYEAAKSPPQQVIVSCTFDNAEQVLMKQCVAGGLIRLIDIKENEWTVIIDVVSESSV